VSAATEPLTRKPVGALRGELRTGEGREVGVAMVETMASCMLVEHANGAMFDPARPAMYPRIIALNRCVFPVRRPGSPGRPAAAPVPIRDWAPTPPRCSKNSVSVPKPRTASA
jgi:crotonobetainyl-CoA:carnitine CoA-transferase CaiB-like acyl-CoA transferase